MSSGIKGYRASLVARVFNRGEQGNVYSLVVKYPTLRILICIANQYELIVSHLDMDCIIL